MKKVIGGEKLKNKIKEAVDLLCDTVKVTLGPKGNNVIIDHSNFSPFITNDGVTIAMNIESDDEVTNTILELAKEASIKTNEIVGDGTTTTLVLLQSIFNEGLKLINNGINPIILKKELDKSVNDIIKKIKNMSKKPTDEDLLTIATISSNDEEIGKIVTDAYIKTKNKNAISIIETNNDKNNIKYVKGYEIDTELASPYYLRETKEINLFNSNILLIDNILNDIDNIGSIINHIINKNESLIIMANEYSEFVINEILSLNIENNLNIYLLKTPEYGFNGKNILKDISAITNAKIIKNNLYSINDLGKVFEINLNEEKTLFSFTTNEKITKRIKKIEETLETINNDYEKNFFLKSLSMFKTCLAIIEVGAPTILERREKKMRFDDALCAIDIAHKGIVPGSGLIFLEISNELLINNNGDKILKEALISPIKQILTNSGLDDKNIIDKIIKEKYKIIYNIKTETFENINSTNIKDPTEVLINSLKNACSIAGMLLTTSNIIINEYKNNINKINDFNEL